MGGGNNWVEEEGEEGNFDAVTSFDTVHAALEMLNHFRHIALAGMELALFCLKQEVLN